MPEYIPVTDEVVFFEKVGETKYLVIHEGLPFTIPKGPISMVITHVDRSKRYVDQLVAGTVYEPEPRPSDPEGQAAYDEALRDQATKNERLVDAHVHGNTNVTKAVARLP